MRRRSWPPTVTNADTDDMRQMNKMIVLLTKSRGNLARTPDVAVVIPLKLLSGPCG